MIRVYEAEEKLFNNNGIKILKPIKCDGFKADNGDYYIEIEDKIENINFYQVNMIITCPTPFPEGIQAFRIVNLEKKNNKLSAKAKHVYFDSANYIIRDSYIVEKNCNYALNHLNNNCDIETPFTISSNINELNSYRCIRHSLEEAISVIVDRWDGHLVRDNFNISVNSTIGTDRGITLEYAKNITEIKSTEDWSNVLTKILPVGKDGLLLPEIYLEIEENPYDIPFTKVVSFDQDLEKLDEETDDEYTARLIIDLREQATEYLYSNIYPKVNYSLNAHLDKITDVGDTIYVKHPKMNINLMTNVISVKWDAISNKYKNIEFGNFRKELKNLIKDINNSVLEDAAKEAKNISQQTKVFLENELKTATSQIWNMLGNSYVIYEGDKILIVDTLPKEQATNVIMINSGGIGFSQTGINGTFNSAWSIDGTLDMQHINVINLVADMIKGGTLKLGGDSNTNGTLEIYNSDGNIIGKIDNEGITFEALENIKNQLTELSSITNTIKGNSPLKIENAIKSTLHSLKIKGDSEVSDSKLRVYSKNEEVDGTEIELNYNPKSKNLFDIDYYSNVDNYINDTNNYCCHLTNLPKTRLYVKCELIGEEQSGLYFRIGNTPSQTAESLYASIIQNGACRSFNVDTSSWENIYLRYYTKDFDISKLKENYRIMISTDDINWIPYDEHGGMYYLGKNLFDVNTATKSYGNFEQTINNGILTLTATGTLGAQFSQVILKNLNASKSYCLSFKAKKTSLGQDGRPYIQIVIYGSSDGSTYRWLYNVVETNPTLNQEYSFSKLGITGYSSYRFYIYNNTGTPVTIGEQTKYYDILFKEGDEITPYEPYAFSTQETRSGKNLFDIDEWLSSRGAIYEKQNNVYKIANTSQLYSNKYQLNLKPNTIYSLSNKYYKQDSTNIMIEIFENDTRIGYIFSSNDQKNYYTFTTDSSSSYYVRLNYTTRVYPVVFDSVMLSEGTEITSYEPYGVSPSPDYPSPIINKYPAGKYKTIIDDKIYTFELTDDLRSVPGVRDELWLDIENMKLEINRKIGNVVLDGSESWDFNSSASTANGYYEFGLNLYNKPRRIIDLLCDNFQSGTTYDNSKEQIRTTTSTYIYISILGTRLSSLNTTGFKTWLSTHNTTVYYELAEQITEERDITVIYQEYNLNINELYSLNDTNDEFVDLNGQALITKKIGIKNNDTKYELEEPMVSDLGNIFINLLDGVNIIEFEDGFELEVVYFIDNELTRAFLSTSTSNKEQSEQRETIEQNSFDISNISANLNNNYKNNSQLNQLLEQQRQEILTEQNVTMTQTKEQWALEVLQRLNSEGIEKLKNMLVAIDINGINVSKSDEDVVSLLNNLGLYVSDGKLKEDLSNLLMKADRSGAYFKMIEILLTIKEQGIIQKEKINHPKYGICQAHYWIGG